MRRGVDKAVGECIPGSSGDAKEVLVPQEEDRVDVGLVTCLVGEWVKEIQEAMEDVQKSENDSLESDDSSLQNKEDESLQENVEPTENELKAIEEEEKQELKDQMLEYIKDDVTIH